MRDKIEKMLAEIDENLFTYEGSHMLTGTVKRVL